VAHGDPARQRAEVEYQLLQAELELAKQTRPYLVFDWQASELVVKVKGAPVARFGLQVVDDAQTVRRFQQRFLGPQERAVRGVALRRLYTAQHQHSDSILAIVGKVLSVDPQTLQRQVPGHFELGWGDGAILEVHVDLGEPAPPRPPGRWQRVGAVAARLLEHPAWQGLRCSAARWVQSQRLQPLATAATRFLGPARLRALRRAVAGPCLDAHLRVSMQRRDAMALYRVAEPGAPTLMPISL